MDSPTYTNRLSEEKSPYLLQHAHNPVDWYPWGDAAFQKAADENKLVFLSIGYSTCHWCHVMERECFEDVEVAAVLNSVCVPIKVDREERPDLDHVYMAVCQTLNGNGGWPLNVLLTPDRVPFFAATYLPKRSLPGRLGIMDLLHQVGALWRDTPDRVLSTGTQILEHLRRSSAQGKKGAELSGDLFREAAATFRREFDPEHGGFGAAPKFPTPHNLVFLLRRFARDGDRGSLELAIGSLRAMHHGGLFDHLGGGFHRYSTDREWLLPHFEKMLYDQAGLALANLEAYQASGEVEFADITRQICDYVLRDLTDPEGGFHSAEDADSEGVEGKFYVWTQAEVLAALGNEEGALFCQVYEVAAEGNFEDEATRRKTGANILHLRHGLDHWASRLGVTPELLGERLAACRGKLLAVRSRRVRPHLDDKVITAWNGMMISALARGGNILAAPEYGRAARRAAEFLWRHMRPAGRLLRRYRDGEAAVPGFAEDFAFLARAFLDLYATGFDPEDLARALALGGELHERFLAEDGALYDTAADAEALIVRPREVYDGATPSANSVALEVFARLGLLTGDPAWTDRARRLAEAWAPRVAAYPAAFTQFLNGLALLLEPTREVVVVGEPDGAAAAPFLQVLASAYAPTTSVVLRPPEGGRIVDLAPFCAEMVAPPGAARVYVCQDFTCQAPLDDPAALAELLKN